MTTNTGAEQSFDWRVLPNRNVEMLIAGDVETPVAVNFPPHMVSMLASGALMAAHAAHEKLQETGGEAVRSEEDLPAIPIKKVGLARSNLVGFKTLVLEVGEATVGFAIPNGALKDLGQLLMSLDEEDS